MPSQSALMGVAESLKSSTSDSDVGSKKHNWDTNNSGRLLLVDHSPVRREVEELNSIYNEAVVK